MLRANPNFTPITHDALGQAAAHAAVWLDLLSPTEAEHSFAELATGLLIPARADIAEIETSSRLAESAGVLTLSTPMVAPGADGHLAATPLGFVMTETRLITLRYGENPLFNSFAARYVPGPAPRGAEALLGLLEAMVDQLADYLEHTGGTLEKISAHLFDRSLRNAGSGRRRDALLRNTLTDIGRLGDVIGMLRDALLGLGRIVRYIHETALFLTETERRRLKTQTQDIVSLTDYDTQLSNKVQFVLDATLGFINIEQNNGIKVLTVVSLVGIPPTLVASIYGMNFEHMPELHWAWGYQYALLLIACSVVLPLAWFRWRRWL